MPEKLLEVNHLRTSFFTAEGEVKSVSDVSYYVNRGEVIAIVGESGCGKSVTQMSVMQLVQTPPGRIIGGEVMFDGKSLLEYDAKSKEMRAIRGAGISMIFQEPMTSLNPVLTVGEQLSDVICTHSHLSKKEAWKKGIEALAAVGIPEPEARMRCYPFEMSGGMRQRVMIAISVACDSKLIIADEPTTALDVTTQAQVMDLLIDMVHKYNKSLIIITHNLGLVTRYAQRVYVMYAGKIVESGTTEKILTHPEHLSLIHILRRGGSTNAGKISLAGRAVPTLVLGIPSRYVHSHYNFCAVEDIEAAVRMAVEVIRGLDSRRIGLLMHRDILE